MRAIILVMALGSVARAEDPIAEARALYAKGADLVKRAQWAEALNAFERSNEKRPHPITTYNVAICERALGHYVRAKTTLAKALEGASELPPSMQSDARGYLTEMEKLAAHVMVTVRPSDATLAVDGAAVQVPSEKFELPLDPGAHVFTVSRKGFADVAVNRSFVPGAQVELKLELDKLPAMLHVGASKPGAAVSIDGVDVGVAPVDVQRPAGDHRVAVRKAGCQTYEAHLKLGAGEEVSLNAPLAEQKTPIYKRWWFWTVAGVVVAGVAVGAYYGAKAAETPSLDGGGLGWAVKAR
jgi:hypothetical protein